MSKYRRTMFSLFERENKMIDVICKVTGRNRSDVIRCCIRSVYNEMLRRGFIKEDVNND